MVESCQKASDASGEADSQQECPYKQSRCPRNAPNISNDTKTQTLQQMTSGGVNSFARFSGYRTKCYTRFSPSLAHSCLLLGYADRFLVLLHAFDIFFYLDAAWLNEGRCPGGRPSVSENQR